MYIMWNVYVWNIATCIYVPGSHTYLVIRWRAATSVTCAAWRLPPSPFACCCGLPNAQHAEEQGGVWHHGRHPAGWQLWDSKCWKLRMRDGEERRSGFEFHGWLMEILDVDIGLCKGLVSLLFSLFSHGGLRSAWRARTPQLHRSIQSESGYIQSKTPKHGQCNTDTHLMPIITFGAALPCSKNTSLLAASESL